MAPAQIYRPEDINPAYHLRYNWTGWPARDHLLPPEPDEVFFDKLADAWETDGIRLLEREWTRRRVRLLASVTPKVTPTFFAGRMKGRLQHALRQHGTPTTFSRKLAVRTVGDNRRTDVDGYIERQVAKEDLADPRFAAFLEQFTTLDEEVDLAQPRTTDAGRYWYNLHVVLAVRGRPSLTDAWLADIDELCGLIADKNDHRLRARSVMTDHLHLGLGATIDESPEDVALGYMNNIAYALRQDALWKPSYYVGTFGEYGMAAIRQRVGS